MACYIASGHGSLPPLFPSLSLFLRTGMNGEARAKRGEGEEREREKDLAENTPDDGFGETRSEREGRQDRRREGAIDGYLGRQI